jgi:hypothetical protein
MKEVKVYLSVELDVRFRKAAMENYGYGRGSLSKAAQEALLEWCRGHEKASPVEEPSRAPSGNATQKEKDVEKEEKKSPEATNGETSLSKVTPMSASAGSSRVTF